MWPFNQSENSIARAKLVDEMKREDDAEQAKAKQRQAKMVEQVMRYREKYPVGTEFSVIGKKVLVKNIYCNFPGEGYEVEGLSYAEKSGFYKVSFPIEILEKAIKES